MTYTFDDCDAFFASLTTNANLLPQENDLNDINLNFTNFSNTMMNPMVNPMVNPMINNMNSNYTNSTVNPNSYRENQYNQPDSYSSLSPNSLSSGSGSHSPMNGMIMDPIYNTTSHGSHNSAMSNHGFSNTQSSSISNPDQGMNQYMNPSQFTQTPQNNNNQNSLQQQIQQIQNMTTAEDIKFEAANSLPSDFQLKNSNYMKSLQKGQNGITKPHKKEKSSHNMIEKRYRTNINDKIKQLRDSVPALRVIVESSSDEEGKDDIKLDGLQPAKKLNKATILSKAIEYIKHLENKNQLLYLQNENFKRLIMSSSTNSNPNMNMNHLNENQNQINQMMQQNNGNYPTAPTSTTNSNANRSPNQSSIKNKIMMGSLALMVGSGINDDFGGNDSRSLFAVPFPILNSEVMLTITKFFKLFLIGVVAFNLLFPIFMKFMKVRNLKFIAEDIFGLRIDSVDRFDELISGKEIIDKFQILKNFALSFAEKKSSKLSFCKSIQVKLIFNNFGPGFFKRIVDSYACGLWEEAVLLKDTDGNSSLKKILSLPNSTRIINDDHYIKEINVLLNSKERDSTTLIGIVCTLVNEYATERVCDLIVGSALDDDEDNSKRIEELLNKVDKSNQTEEEVVKMNLTSNLFQSDASKIAQMLQYSSSNEASLDPKLKIGINCGIILNLLDQYAKTGDSIYLEKSIACVANLKINQTVLNLVNFISYFKIMAQIFKLINSNDIANISISNELIKNLENILINLRVYACCLDLKLNIRLKELIINQLIDYFVYVQNFNFESESDVDDEECDSDQTEMLDEEDRTQSKDNEINVEVIIKPEGLETVQEGDSVEAV